MRRTTLTTEQRAALQQARHDPNRPPYARDRIEMLLLSAAGWSPPRIAAHLGCHAKTVRQVLDRFPTEGLDCLVRQSPGPPPDTARRSTVERALTTLLAEDRTWTAAQLGAALQEQQITLGPRHLRRYLRGMHAGYRRTVRSLKHKQVPEKVAVARQEIATFKKGRQQAN
jgi:putative transposase